MLKLEAFLRWPVFKSCLIDSMLLRYCCRRCCFLHLFLLSAAITEMCLMFPFDLNHLNLRKLVTEGV